MFDYQMLQKALCREAACAGVQTQASCAYTALYSKGVSEQLHMPPSCQEGQADQLRITTMSVERHADSPLHLRSGAKVTLYEKEQVFGGHTLTDDSSAYPVDLGFQVLAMGVRRPCHPDAALQYRGTDCASASCKHVLCDHGDVNVMNAIKLQRM